MDKQEGIIRGNILIAKYEGAKENGGTTLLNDEWVNIVELVYKYTTHYYIEDVRALGLFSPAVLIYHKEWNWLIPVVNKLLQELRSYQKIAGSIADDVLLGELESRIAGIEVKLVELEIEPLWECVVQGITELNKMKKNVHKETDNRNNSM